MSDHNQIAPADKDEAILSAYDAALARCSKRAQLRKVRAAFEDLEAYDRLESQLSAILVKHRDRVLGWKGAEEGP